MAPHKPISVRNMARPTTFIGPFRDDTGLVGLRYEQTKQAELPVPMLPTRNPLRTSTTIGLGSHSHSRPVVVVAPSRRPHEQHPLLRDQSDEGSRDKRDSGLAHTSPSTTIWESGEDMGRDGVVGDDDTDRRFRGKDQASYLGVGLCTRAGAPHTPPHQALGLFTIPPEIDRPCSASSSHMSSPTHRQRRRLAKTSGLTSTIDRYKQLRQRCLSNVHGGVLPLPPIPPMPLVLKSSPESESLHAHEEARDPILDWPAPSLPPISTQVAADSFFDDLDSTLTFSNRGSIMFGGRRAIDKSAALAPPEPSPSPSPSSSPSPSPSLSPSSGPANMSQSSEPSQADGPSSSRPSVSPSPSPSPVEESGQPAPAPALAPAPAPRIHVVTADVERESQKVRSLYDAGEGLDWKEGARAGERLSPTKEAVSDEEDNSVSSPLPSPRPGTRVWGSSSSLRPDSQMRREHELAGGLEDWEDVQGTDVDRYGFIHARPVSRIGSPDIKTRAATPPRRRNLLSKRLDMNSPLGPAPLGSSPLGPVHGPGRKVSARSLNTYTSEMSVSSRRSTRSSMRSATNRLPYNRDRRFQDEAGDMLTLEPGLAGIVEDEADSKAQRAARRKEWERSEKWRRMAKVVKKGKDGEGMDFEFDVKSTKVVERTWKGIPDCWRAAAWHSFLLASARCHRPEDTDDKLAQEFRRLQDVSSSDDVQIDLDVPRTVSQHIMFRRRYRGGQRLLFRVLHAVALYFPDTGYVQGMASLAATLLCYYDEEQAFAMMVRLWEYRGLKRLYQPGFGGLMAALKDFETIWLGNKPVAAKLTELAIDPTAYCTRWYLTLFNLSVPFAAQLRVWDVFMLLGDSPPDDAQAVDVDAQAPPPPAFDVLHATGAALMQALREVLLDSDFENAMKALTSWVPVQDEELLMKVTRAEYKQHRARRHEKA